MTLIVRYEFLKRASNIRLVPSSIPTGFLTGRGTYKFDYLYAAHWLVTRRIDGVGSNV